MAYTIPPRLTSILEERNRLAPRARGAPVWRGVIPSSDGTIGDATHAASESDHNPDARGVVHACDVSQSMPGSPYWDPRCEQFDVFAHFHRIINDWYSLDSAGRQRKYGWLKYLIWYEAALGCEAIWSPVRAAEGIRRNGNKQGHREHGHISINYDPSSEQDTQPIFSSATVEDDVTPEDREAIKSDTKAVVAKALEEIPALVEAAINKQFGGYSPSGQYVDGLLITSARKKYGLSKP